jgi:hypothetical protein
MVEVNDGDEDLWKVGGMICKTHERWGNDLQMHFCKSPLPSPMSAPWDQHRVVQIEVSIVCMEGSAST